MTVTGRPLPARRRARERDRAVGVVEQRRAGAGAADLRHRAAHVEVDQVGARGGDRRGGRAHHVGVGAEQLDRDRAAGVARAGRSAAARCRSARCGSGRRSSTPSRRRRGRRRSGAPGGARTSCRCPASGASTTRLGSAQARAPASVSGHPQVSAVDGARRASARGGRQRLSSQISRRPSSVSRSSTTSIEVGERGHEVVGEAAGRDHRRLDAELVAQPRDDAVDLAGEAVDDSRADGVDGRLADQRARLAELDLRQLGGALRERLERDLDARRDDPAEVLALVGDDVVGDRGAEVDDDAGALRSASHAATALTSRSAPSSRGLSSRIGMPVLTPGPTTSISWPR